MAGVRRWRITLAGNGVLRIIESLGSGRIAGPIRVEAVQDGAGGFCARWGGVVFRAAGGIVARPDQLFSTKLLRNY